MISTIILSFSLLFSINNIYYWSFIVNATISYILQITLIYYYPNQIDEKNHKSLNSLVHILEDSGYGDIAQVVEEQKNYLLIDSPLMATKVNDFINEHSAAIYSSLTYKGLKNSEAVDLIHKEFPKEKEEKHTSQHHFTIKK